MMVQIAPKSCRVCGTVKPTYDNRTLKVVRGNLSTKVKDVRGWFCIDPTCSEIEFDELTNSLERWVAAGDKLIKKQRYK